jgi:mannose-1-phosphate guanylyltransferase
MRHSIILAGGEGQRTRPFIARWLGCHRPEQYCSFVGRRSMFQHTVDRADRLAPGANRISVVAPGHRALVMAQLAGRPVGQLFWQPQSRGTAAGILWPVSRLMTDHSDDVAIVHPSDHFIWPETAFVEALSSAVRVVGQKPERLVLIGAKPDQPELDYGWILPEENATTHGAHRFRKVRRFFEKPSEMEAKRAFAEGALWNTSILVGTVRTFWQLGRYCLPETMELLDWVRVETGPECNADVTRQIYAELPEKSFSRDVLEKVPELLTVMELSGVDWCDWGRSERIVHSIQKLGRTPAFPTAIVSHRHALAWSRAPVPTSVRDLEAWQAVQ